ncbi:hypothetical protein SAMN05660653_01531 [Desulfonatronum thiosulfatophilum]|uniref:Uncharacterized protein n=1 Tax=Desulfonatronum thiosulfatophilum TaxID=617002 RepID=A0A1G6CHL2_9BACT|nr:hypothetical protein [Desulfonatronum thiosulfatophilum]SDB32354.1 hypothetical protein SAMN05660653_01531 [Desulfonatronum thiosulfatophilum]
MAAIVYDPVQFHKKMNKMRKAGGRAGIAVRQAEAVIQELADSDQMDQRLCSKLTQYGDARIQNCFKFNLVSGYRLVLTKKEGLFVILFLGTHNETDHWIRNNAGIRPDLAAGEVVPALEPAAERLSESSICENHEKPDFMHDIDKPLHEFIDQKTLQEIFRGICNQPRKSLNLEQCL